MSSAATALPAIKVLVLDFDSTISTPTYLNRVRQWAVADNVKLFNSMSEDEIMANFGGPERLATLAALLSEIETAGIRLYIISIGYKAAFVPHLRASGLIRFFPDDARLFGQDSPILRKLEFNKGRLIAKIMEAEGYQHRDVLFVDDSKDHIEKATPVCRTLLVESKATVGGMGQMEFDKIREAARLSAR